jgi:hypothetical protein
VIFQLIGSVMNGDYSASAGCYPCTFPQQFHAICRCSRDRRGSSIEELLLHFVSASVRSGFATRGVVELSILSIRDEIVVLDEQLIQPPKPDSVRDRGRDRIMKGLREQAALLKGISYPYRAKKQHWNTPLIHLSCLKAIHRRMDFTKRQLKHFCAERRRHKEERSSSGIRVSPGL